MPNYSNPVKVTAGTFKCNCANASCQSYEFALLEGCKLFQNKYSLNQTSSSAAELDLQTCSFLSRPSRIGGYELFPSCQQLPKSDRAKGHQHMGDITFQNSKQSLPHSFVYKTIRCIRWSTSQSCTRSSWEKSLVYCLLQPFIIFISHDINHFQLI